MGFSFTTKFLDVSLLSIQQTGTVVASQNFNIKYEKACIDGCTFNFKIKK